MTEMTEPTIQELQQAVQDAVQAAQDAKQTAQQIAEQVGQSVSQAIQKFLQTTGTSTAGTTVQSEIGDVGGTEAHERSLNNETGILFANAKRTYDEYQQESLESIKRNRTYVDKVLSDALQYDNQRQVIANQSLQNAVETANMVGKQAVRHGDLSIDRQWNVDEAGYTAASIIDSMNSPAVKQAMAATIADILAAMAAKEKTS